MLNIYLKLSYKRGCNKLIQNIYLLISNIYFKTNILEDM